MSHWRAELEGAIAEFVSLFTACSFSPLMQAYQCAECCACEYHIELKEL
jgi:hypothetical protein